MVLLPMTVRKNGADTALSIAMNSDDAAGTVYTDSDAVSFAENDKVAIRTVNSAGANRAIKISLILEFET